MAAKGNRNRYSISSIGGYYLSLIYKIIFMKVLLFSLFVFISIGANAQSFFKPLPKIQPPTTLTNSLQRSIISKTVVTNLDSTYGAFRPMVVTGYSLPDSHVMAGAGFGYQNITYNYATQRSYCNYSINLVGFAGGSVTPKGQGDIVSYGIMIGALNNLVMAGAALNAGKVQAVISFGINFNN